MSGLAGSASCGGDSRTRSRGAPLLSEMAPDCRSRRSHLVDRGEKFVARDIEAVGSVFGLGIVRRIDKGLRRHAWLRGQHRGDCCEADHATMLARMWSRADYGWPER